MWLILGGSGFEKFDGFETLREINRQTPFGPCSSGFKKVKVAGQEALFISRHGENHELTPSEVNYRANIFAAKRAGAKAVLSFSAVGSLQAEFKPGDLVVPTQYIDRTKSRREHTFCGGGIVGHMSLAKPVCEKMVERLSQMVQGKPWDSHFGKTYLCIEGPNFSTIAESNFYRALRADIIGMTHFPEYALAREAGMPYLPCCFVTDYDCWDQSRPHVTLEEVIQVMRENNSKAFSIAQEVLSQGAAVYEGCNCSNEGLRTGLMTPPEKISPTQREWLEILIH
ncbi:MAG: MTAP family purine nucleoside phosphorylase [Bdellovibrionales bacterium]|nr:MTAP family purine nucleoside phosphorylase [Bdellovibrionales bacterium]